MIHNTIENLFSQWRHFTKQSKPQNEEELINAIDQVATDNTIVTAAHCAAYVRKVSQNCHNCTLGAVDFENWRRNLNKIIISQRKNSINMILI